jgi:hypothetical protein
MSRPPKAVSDYMASIGKKGGEAKGDSKLRGDPEYYKRISALAAIARAKKRRKKKEAK